MKKTIIIALAAVVALASCTKVEKKEVAKETPMTFKVINYLQQTKANTAYTGDAFGTFAFWTATNWETDGDANVYMNNDKIIYGPDYAQGEWGPEDARYWTKTGCITFASYSPYTTGSDNGFSEIPVFTKEKGFVFNNYTVPINGDVDLMVADLIADQSKNNPEYMLSQNTDGVPTLFRHVLSQIAFKFQTVDNPNPNVEDSQIIINSVTIQNVHNKGTYTQNNTDDVWANESGKASYEYNNSDSPITVNPDDDAPQGTDVESMILLPQDLEEGVQQIVIDYTIRTKYESNDEWAEENVTTTIDLVTDAIDEWEPNQSIVYTITINPVDMNNPILFDPAVADWTPVASDAIAL